MNPGEGDYVIAMDVAVSKDESSVVAVGEEYKAARAAVWTGR